MLELPSTSTAELSAEQKRFALEQVLRSQTFARCDQLKSFLQYVCELEIAGQGNKLNEYLIGVEALGRPQSYSPGEDSAVRNRAYALRRKLQEFYSNEARSVRVRIDLPKGSYSPRFVALEAPADVELTDALVTVPSRQIAALPQVNAASSPTKRGLSNPALAFLTGVVVTGVTALLLFWWGASRVLPKPSVAPVISEAWGTLLAPDANTLVCVATPAHLMLRQYDNEPPPHPPLHEAPVGVYDWYMQRHQLSSDAKLYMLKTHNSPRWGDAVGALTAVKVLTASGASYQVLPERVVPFPSLRERNLVLLGTPEHSGAATRILQRGMFEVVYSPSLREHVIQLSNGDKSNSQVFVSKRDQHQIIYTYGLITVLPSEGAIDGQQRTIVFTGLTSAGVQAAAEFFSSPNSLMELKKRLLAEGHATFPLAYQVVVKSTSDSTLSLNISYETHWVIR